MVLFIYCLRQPKQTWAMFYCLLSFRVHWEQEPCLKMILDTQDVGKINLVSWIVDNPLNDETCVQVSMNIKNRFLTFYTLVWKTEHGSANYVFFSVSPAPTFLLSFLVPWTVPHSPWAPRAYHRCSTNQPKSCGSRQQWTLAFSPHFVMCHIHAQDSKAFLLHLQCHIQHKKKLELLPGYVYGSTLWPTTTHLSFSEAMQVN